MFRIASGRVGKLAVAGIAGSVFASHASCSKQSVTANVEEMKRFPAPKLVSLKDKVVLVTGATAGIGTACVWRFAEEGSNLILMARREDRLVKLKKDLLKEYPQLKVHIVVMSVADIDGVKSLPAALPKEFGDVDILVNNAGFALGVNPVQKGVIEDIVAVLNTNVIGTMGMCTAFFPGMVERQRGHVINIGSVSGHWAMPTASVYNSSKFAVNGYTLAARHDVAHTPIRVTHISPGTVQGTEFSNVRYLGDDKRASTVYDGIEALRPEDVADNVIYAATRPPHVQIADIIMYATNQSGPNNLSRVGSSLGAK